MTTLIPQLIIVVLGVSAVFLGGSKSSRGRFWAGVLGLCAQPAWLWTTIANGQYLIAGLCLVYGGCWVRTIRNNRKSCPTFGSPLGERS